MTGDLARATPEMHGVIFSGGGADGAYQIGVVKALFNGKSRATFGRAIEPNVFSGTSIGSFNASYLVSHWDELGAAAVGRLERVWLERLAWQGSSNGGFRLRMNPFSFLDPREYLKHPLRPLTQLADDVGHIGWEAASRTYNLMTSEAPILERFTDFFNLSSFVVVEPWEKTLREEIDYEKIRTSKKKLRIAATNWTFGDVRQFENSDMTDGLGPAAIRASSSVPGFYPPAEVGAQTYVDGAVLMNTPLSPAIKAMIECLREDPYAGLWDLPMREAVQLADEAYATAQFAAAPEMVLHVIYMNTEVEKMPLAALENTLKTLYRTQIISWASIVNQDIETAALLNQGLEFVHDLHDFESTDQACRALEEKKAAGSLTADEDAQLTRLQQELAGGRMRRVQQAVEEMSREDMSKVLQSARSIVRRMRQGKPYRPITIHRYFPPDGLGGALGFLDVRRGRLERLIAEGFDNTVQHDCKTNNCVLAGKHKRLGQ